MKSFKPRNLTACLVCLALLGALGSASLIAQEKKYAEICGDYEFDFQGEITIINFYEEDGKLMAAPEGETPEEISPVEGEPMKFDVTVEANGMYYEILFKKDEAGEYNLCLITVGGMEIEGKRIK